MGAHPSGTIGEDPCGTPNNLMPFVAQVAVGRRPRLQIFGNDYETPDGSGVRDYLHVQDLAEGHVAALRHLLAGGASLTVNLGTGRGVSVLELVRAFERASGRRVPYEIAPRRPGDVAACYADPALAERLLGWKARLGLEAMCADSWRWQAANPTATRPADPTAGPPPRAGPLVNPLKRLQLKGPGRARKLLAEYTEVDHLPQSSESPAAGRYPKGSFMGVKLKVAGWLALGAVAGALTTLQLEATARNSVAQLPIEELQQLAAVFGMVKSDYVEPVDEKKLIGDAIGGMVAGLDPHSQYFDKKTFKEFREGTTGRFVGIGIEMGMEDGLVKVVSPDRRLARLPRRPQERRPDHQDRRHRWSSGLTVDQAVKRMRGEPQTPRSSLTVFRKTESRTFPVTIIARGDPRCRACAPSSSSPATPGCASASSRTARSTTSPRSSTSSTSRTPT